MSTKEKKGTGALPDIRPETEKEKDYHIEETVASFNPVVWIEKPRSDWRKFPIFDQNGSGSCVAQTAAKMLGIMYSQKNNGEYVHFSATHIYQRRQNKPSSGMWGIDCLDIARAGTTLEVLTPSQALTDQQMDSAQVTPVEQRVGEQFKTGNYVVFNNGDIETVASTIQTTGKGVMVWFYFLDEEWTDVPFIKDANLPSYGANVRRHSVTAVDYVLHKGQKALIIEDSWGKQYGLGGQRIITEDFFKRRNFFSAYMINFAFETGEPTPTPLKPQYRFTKQLYFSPTYITDPDVVALQDILKYEGVFPANVDSTGYYGSITAKAVLAFQKKHGVASDAELDSLQGRVVGNKTLAALNRLYS